jgi:predicted membrane channel-forming protein YqfA (hemolysin III family)
MRCLTSAAVPFPQVCGILLVLLGGGPVLYWGLHCHPVLRTLYLVAYYCAGVACAYAVLTARSAAHRALPMLLLMIIRVSALVVRLAVLRHGHVVLLHYAAMELYSLAGGAINVLRIPERWFQPANGEHPAPLDYVGNSHQLMHVLVMLALIHLHLGMRKDYLMQVALKSGVLQCSK